MNTLKKVFILFIVTIYYTIKNINIYYISLNDNELYSKSLFRMR